MKGRPDDWTTVVKANWKRLTTYIVSSDHPSCVKMAKDDIRFIDRHMKHVPLGEVAALDPPDHWFMAVILCPGDDLGVLAKWAADQDADRIHFYLHKDTDVQVLAPWRDADLPLDRIEMQRFTTWGPLHKVLGLDLNDQVYGDFAPI